MANKGSFTKGDPRAGRRPGSQNKVGADIRSMISGALDEAGGKQYLVDQAHANPTAFLALVGRTVPRDVNLALTRPLKLLHDGRAVTGTQG